MPDTITERLAGYFRRQIAYLEDAIRALETAPALNDADAIASWAAQRVQSEEKLRELAAEFEELLREWQNTSPAPEASNTNLRALAQTADSLADALQTAMDATAIRLHDRMVEIQALINETRRGQRALTQYRPVPKRESGYMDRQA